MEFTTGLIIFAVLAILFLIYKLYNYSIRKALKEEVSWCVSNDNQKRGNLTLLQHINNVEADLKYKIVTDTEKSIAEEILQCYQEELSQAYYNDRLTVIQKLFQRRYKDNGMEYFFISLSNFLSKHECEKEFNGKEKYITKSFKSYGEWGGLLYDATYSLTDIWKVYHKH